MNGLLVKISGPLAPATHVSSGSAQLCVQGSYTDQTIELGVRIVERRQWLVRPWGIASAGLILDRPFAACADGLAMGSQLALAKLVCPVVHQVQSMAANAISTLCIAFTGQHHGEAGAGATRARFS